MNEFQSTLLSDARAFVSDLFQNKVNKNFTFHNLDHTLGVVKACEEMAGYYELNDNDRLALFIAAWFHDTGFSKGESHGHEEVSIQHATAFLQEHLADPAFIRKVAECIEATKIPQSPKNFIEQILCDADLTHLGTDEFTERKNLLRDELIGTSNQDISKKQWRRVNINFLENHKYFTDYGRRMLQPVKEKHLEELNGHEKKGGKGKKPKLADTIFSTFPEQGNKNPETKNIKEKEERAERSVSTVFRIMASNHANLSHMADNKAHIMISVNSIIISVVIALLVRTKVGAYGDVGIPALLMILFSIGAIIFAVLATRPNISRGTFTKEDIQSRRTNLLFFGNFHNMNLQDYDWAMKELITDRNYLYSSMIKDIYFLGVVLAKKYKYLRVSYNIFMYGLIISALSFGIILAWNAIF